MVDWKHWHSGGGRTYRELIGNPSLESTIDSNLCNIGTFPSWQGTHHLHISRAARPWGLLIKAICNELRELLSLREGNTRATWATCLDKWTHSGNFLWREAMRYTVIISGYWTPWDGPLVWVIPHNEGSRTPWCGGGRGNFPTGVVVGGGGGTM